MNIENTRVDYRYSPASFDGGGNSYDKKDGVGGAVAYQNALRSAGYLNTQDYAGQQAEHWRKSSESALHDMAKTAGAIAGATGPGAALRIIGTLVVTWL